ncbi:hypothetical protein K7432_013414 [Basidiobolus ranarum]|uniref:Protein kinase domain-containing protein n=1 Tax=Basidiobolus ranarum TaxID=34480 RepID=A0ABR2VQU8_9FUNG
MLSLGCILCETWMGHTLFASITRREMMAEMTRLLGKFPKEVFKNGKYCDEQFLKSSKDDADIKLQVAQSIANLLKTTDVKFLDFISGLLLYDPSKRLTPGMAVHHPFIADMVPLDSFSDKLYPFLIPLNSPQWTSNRESANTHELSNRLSQGKQVKRPKQEQCDENDNIQAKKRQLNRE